MTVQLTRLPRFWFLTAVPCALVAAIPCALADSPVPETAESKNQVAHPSSAEDIERFRKNWEEGAHDYARSLMLQGRRLRLAGKSEQSFSAYRESVEVLRNVYPRGHAFVLHALDEYIDLVEVLVQANEANEEREEHLLRTLADALMLNNKHLRARATLLSLKSIYEKRDKEQQLRYGECLEDLTDCCIILGQYKEGVTYATEALRLYSKLVEDNDSAARCLVTLARLYAETDQMALADSTLLEAEELTAAVHGKFSKQYGYYLATRARALIKAGKPVPEELLGEIDEIYDLHDSREGRQSLGKKDARAIMRMVEILEDDRKHDYLWHDWERWDRDRVF